MGLGGPVSHGDQGFPWIHLDDLLKAYLFILENPETNGIFNLTAPEILTNNQFTKTLAAVVKRPAIFPVTQFALKMRYGEGAVALLEGAFVEPFRLTESGFKFRYPNLQNALTQIVSG
jgi:NAD dependent epimerase/dehydratase family enzyme